MKRHHRPDHTQAATEALPDQYWLHVTGSGTELRFSRRPDEKEFPTILVEICGDVEKTHTLCYEQYSEGDGVHSFTAVRPRGRGWVPDPDGPDKDKWSFWKRPVVS
jgi:hypothetical protein